MSSTTSSLSGIAAVTFGFGSVVAGLSTSASAEEAAETGIPEGSIATSLPANGDPSGARAALAARGVTFGVNYIGEVYGNTSGGLVQGSNYLGRLEIFTDIDMERALGFKGLTFHANGYQIHGEGISGSNLGSLAPVSSIEAAASTRLFEIWLDQKLIGDQLSVRFGNLAADNEFLLSEGAGAFVNGTWGWPTIAADNLPSGGPAYPFAVPAVRLAFNPNDSLGFLLGVYNGDAFDTDGCVAGADPQDCNPNGLDFPFGDKTFMMLEAAYKYNQGEGQIPGTIKLGGWKHFGEFDDQRRDVNGGALAVTGLSSFRHTSNYGLYVVWDQMVWRVPGTTDSRGLSVFSRFITSPDDRNQIDWYAEAGVTLTGLVNWRLNDVLGIGFAYTGISDAARGFDRDSGIAVGRDYESLLEISYTAEIIPGWTVQPDFQYYWNPGGRIEDPKLPGKAVDDAAVIGVRTSLSY